MSLAQMQVVRSRRGWTVVSLKFLNAAQISEVGEGSADGAGSFKRSAGAGGVGRNFLGAIAVVVVLIREMSLGILRRPGLFRFVAAGQGPRDLDRDIALFVVGGLDRLVLIEEAAAAFLNAVLRVVAVRF